MELSDGLKKIFLAGVGAVATTAESAKELVDTLVTKGEITMEQGKVLNEELRHSTKEKLNKHISVNIVKEDTDIMKQVEKLSKEERDVLKAKLDEIKSEEENNNE